MAIAKVTSAILRSIGHGCPLAVLYRWKHLERASCWCHRARAQHQLLDRAFTRVFSPKDIEQAQSELNDANAQGDDNAGAKTTVQATL